MCYGVVMGMLYRVKGKVPLTVCIEANNTPATEVLGVLAPGDVVTLVSDETYRKLFTSSYITDKHVSMNRVKVLSRLGVGWVYQHRLELVT